MFNKLLVKPPLLIRLCSSLSRRFTKDHEWISKTDNNTYKMGLSKFALDELGEVIYLEHRKQEGDKVNKDEELFEIESIKAISTINAPFNLEIDRINNILSDDFTQINDKDWIIEFSSNSMPIKDLLNEEEYNNFVKNI